MIYWAGDPNDQGVCDLGGAHEGDRGQNYVMPHNIQVTGYNQAGWKFCGKCRAMFYDGGESKGNCPAAGPHQSIASGLAYVLPTAAPVKFDDD